MTTKDYVYLGLILLTALVFYCNGFYAGVSRSRRVYEELLDDGENEEGANPMVAHSGKTVVLSDNDIASELASRRSEIRTHRPDFGLN